MPTPYVPIERRLENLSMYEPNSGCRLFIGRLNTAGYGEIGLNRHKVYAHRVAYELFVGPIAKGNHIDHLCRNTSCINERHLEQVTPRENMLRTKSPPAMAVRTGHCIQGHPFTDDNTYRPPSRPTNRHCRACKYETRRRYNARRKVAPV